IDDNTPDLLDSVLSYFIFPLSCTVIHKDAINKLEFKHFETVVRTSPEQLIKMKIDLYYAAVSPSCQVVLLIGKALGLNFNLKPTNVHDKEHLSSEFLKVKYWLLVLRAILTYLASQYGKDDSLYPKDLKKRAIVDQRLYFDIGTLFPSIRQYIVTLMHGGKPDAEEVTKVENSYELLDKFLEGEEWVAGSNITVADYAIVVNVSVMEGMGFDTSKYHNVGRWLSKAKKTMVGFSEIQEKGIDELKKLITSHKAEHK
ncbi:hypothetical protein ANN_15651, partial [Periplaneta americana]